MNILSVFTALVYSNTNSKESFCENSRLNLANFTKLVPNGKSLKSLKSLCACFTSSHADADDHDSDDNQENDDHENESFIGSNSQVDIQREYDLVQLIGEGWFSRVYLAERRSTREEVR